MPDDRGEAEANSLIDKLFFAGRKDSCENCDVCDNDRIDLCLDCRFKYVTESFTRVRQQAVESCCKAMCGLCRRGDELRYGNDGVEGCPKTWWHYFNGTVNGRCHAAAIRKQGREG